MAANNLAVVVNGTITVYSEPLDGPASVQCSIPLGSATDNYRSYAALLLAHGYAVNGLWGRTMMKEGSSASVAVRRV